LKRRYEEKGERNERGKHKSNCTSPDPHVDRQLGERHARQRRRRRRVTYAADNVKFIIAPPLQYTRDNPFGKKALEQWFSSFQGPIGYEIRDLNITIGDDVAFCHSLNRMRATTTGEEKVDLWFRESLGFRKIDGKWAITHEHSSVPFYMDGSYKAVDLKP
jgi:ketosteroid isomerase-like protein